MLRGLNALHQDILTTPARSLDEAVEKLPYLTFPVGRPQDHCPNPKCRKGKKDLMKLLLIMTPDVEEEPLYSSIAGGDEGVLSFLWCTHCYTFRVVHQCT